mmetsp:Transcript_118746/g.335932  ORF Transcript_118746/g.335932 Transcript_118746/m.335932 type:complete len:213 (+) Transcript_118746:1978-2616(+)
MLSEAVKEPGLVHGRHHLALQALVPEAPQRFLVLGLRVLKHDRLPCPLVPVTLCTSGNVNPAAQNSRAEPCPEKGILVQCGRDLVHVQLADRVHAPWYFNLPAAFKVMLEGFHLERGTHEDKSQVSSAFQQVPHEYHVEVCELISFVDLVKHDVCDACEIWIREQPFPEYAQSGKDQTGMSALDVEGHHVTDVFAEGLAPLYSDALRERGGR